MDKICIFAGSSPSALAEFRGAIDELVEALTRRHHGVVFGGVDLGMMGYVARQVRSRGLPVTGVVPTFFLENGLTLVPDIEEVVVNSMMERLEEMCRHSDAFVCLPGGYGTMEELFQILSLQQLGRLAQPCGLLNVGGFFDPILEQIRRAESAALIRPEHAEMLISDSSPSRLLRRLEVLEVPSIVKWKGLNDGD